MNDGGGVIREEDARALVRVLAEVAVISGDLRAKRMALLERLAELVDADAWHWCFVAGKEAGKLPTFSVFLKGGFTEEQFAKYLRAQEHPDMAKFNAPLLAEFAQCLRHITRTRQQLDPEGAFLESDVFQLWREADIAPLILCIRPTASGQASAVSLFRRLDRPLFSERENRIAHILLTEVPWLHDAAWPNHPEQRVSELTPRLHTVTNLLLQGYGRKQIAADLGLSLHTINDYVKEVYQRFGVHSQPELIRRFVDGDGGDR